MANALVTLCVDARRNRVANFSAENAKYTDEAIRQAFYEILGEDKLTYQNWRKHKVEIFEIIEEVLNITLPMLGMNHLSIMKWLILKTTFSVRRMNLS